MNQEKIKDESFDLRISKSNHIFLFREALVSDKNTSERES